MIGAGSVALLVLAVGAEPSATDASRLALDLTGWQACLSAELKRLPITTVPQAGARKAIEACRPSEQLVSRSFDALIAITPADKRASMRAMQQKMYADLPADLAVTLVNQRKADAEQAVKDAATQRVRNLMIGTWQFGQDDCKRGLTLHADGKATIPPDRKMTWSVKDGPLVTINENFDMPAKFVGSDQVILEPRNKAAMTLIRCPTGAKK